MFWKYGQGREEANRGDDNSNNNNNKDRADETGEGLPNPGSEFERNFDGLIKAAADIRTNNRRLSMQMEAACSASPHCIFLKTEMRDSPSSMQVPHRIFSFFRFLPAFLKLKPG